MNTLNSNAATLAAEWLLNSGVQCFGQDSNYEGGVSAWFDLKTESYSFIYSEITGYAVSYFLFHYHQTKEPRFLNAAKSAADWLISHRDPKTGLIINRLNFQHFNIQYYDSWVFVFDQWIIVYGLCNLYETTQEEKYLVAADQVGSFLIDHTIRPDHVFSPIYDLKTNKTQATYDKWSREPGGYHLKALMALKQLEKLTNKPQYTLCAENLILTSTHLQTKEGRFITQQNERSTHLHPHSYSLEGLLLYSILTNRTELLEMVQNGVIWTLSHQHDNGGVYSFYINDAFVPCERVDILAQTLRLGTILLQTKSLPAEYQTHLEKLRTHLGTFQIQTGKQEGGFFYGQEQDGTIHYHVNAWVTMFAGQAISIYDDWVQKNKIFNYKYFV